jgi:hypothetical protein
MSAQWGELERRFAIAVEPGGHVRVIDSKSDPRAGDGVRVYSTDSRFEADELVAAIAVRSREGDGWVLPWSWGGSTRDVGELRARLRRLHGQRRGAA